MKHNQQRSVIDGNLLYKYVGGKGGRGNREKEGGGKEGGRGREF
jgi:hypothetical protein